MQLSAGSSAPSAVLGCAGRGSGLKPYSLTASWSPSRRRLCSSPSARVRLSSRLSRRAGRRVPKWTWPISISLCWNHPAGALLARRRASRLAAWVPGGEAGDGGKTRECPVLHHFASTYAPCTYTAGAFNTATNSRRCPADRCRRRYRAKKRWERRRKRVVTGVAIHGDFVCMCIVFPVLVAIVFAISFGPL